jgi:hypothetical protein
LVIAGRLLKEYSQWGLAQRWSGSTLQDAQDGGLWELLQKAYLFKELTIWLFSSRLTIWLLSSSYKQRGSEFELSASVNNMNKLSLVGLQLPEKYKENFNVSNEGPSSGVQNVEIPLYILQVVASVALCPYQRQLVQVWLPLPLTGFIVCIWLVNWIYQTHLIG